MRSAGSLFLAAVCASKDFSELPSVKPEWFTPSERGAFDFVCRFVARHGRTPLASTVRKRGGFELPRATECASYYRDALAERDVRRSVRSFEKRIGSFVEDETTTDLTGKVSEAFFELLAPSLSQSVGIQMLDYRQAKSTVWPDYRARALRERNYTSKFGWPSLDRQSGGVSRGDMISMVARPSMGKTTFALWWALQQWRQGKRVLVFPLEMRGLPCEQRLLSMDAKLPLSGVRVAPDPLPTRSQQRLLKHFGRLQEKEVPFYIADGNLGRLTVPDLHMQAMLLRPDVIVIDGAYLLRLPGMRQPGRYERIAEVAESIRQELCLGLNLPVFSTWQLSREAARKRKKGGGAQDQPNYLDRVPGLEDIADSDAIGRASTLVLATLEDPNPENVQTKRMFVLKGRDGERGEFVVNWRFAPANFDEAEREERDIVVA